MALNYELKAVEDWQAIPSGTVQCITFALMFTGCPVIDASGKHGWQRVAERIHAWETVTGCIRSDGERITPDLVRRFVGIRTNASPMTDAAFRKHLAVTAMRRAVEAVQITLRAEERAAEQETAQ